MAPLSLSFSGSPATCHAPQSTRHYTGHTYALLLLLRVALASLLQTACETGARPMARFQSVGTVSASQCSALAKGACQRMAASSAYSPCGAHQYFGHKTCSGRQFSDLYKTKVGELCLAAMSKFG